MKSLMLLSSLLFITLQAPVSSGVESFDLPPIESTTPLEDLKSDQDFYNDYLSGEYLKQNEKGFEILNFAEYGYGTDYYGLYFYVWNKSQDENMDLESIQNRVSLYDYLSQQYKHFYVDFISQNNNQFYKFKILDIAQVNFLYNDTRVYDFASFEFKTLQDVNAIDYAVSKKWIYQGSSLNGDLSATVADGETLSLNVGGGVYRTNSSSAGEKVKNDLYYVYFAVPTEILRKYGKLNSIHADYYRFDLGGKVAAVLSTNNDDYLDKYPNIDPYDGMWNSDYPGLNDPWYHWLYDNEDRCLHKNTVLGDKKYLFGSGTYDVYNISMDQFYYNTNDYPYFGYQYDYHGFPIKSLNDKVSGNNIGKDLTLEKASRLSKTSISDAYNDINVYAEDSLDLLSYGDTHNGWDNFWAKLIHGTDTDEKSYLDIPAIQQIKTNHALILEAYKKDYYINDEDVDSIQDYINSFGTTSYNFFILRFDQAYYEATDLRYGYETTRSIGSGGVYVPAVQGDIVGYFAKQYTAVLDFDIIDVSFINDQEEITVLAVVSDPINIYPGIEPPLKGNLWDWLKRILIGYYSIALIILLIVGLVYVWPFISPLFTMASNNKNTRAINKQTKAINKQVKALEKVNKSKDKKGAK